MKIYTQFQTPRVNQQRATHRGALTGMEGHPQTLPFQKALSGFTNKHTYTYMYPHRQCAHMYMHVCVFNMHIVHTCIVYVFTYV